MEYGVCIPARNQQSTIIWILIMLAVIVISMLCLWFYMRFGRIIDEDGNVVSGIKRDVVRQDEKDTLM